MFRTGLVGEVSHAPLDGLGLLWFVSLFATLFSRGVQNPFYGLVARYTIAIWLFHGLCLKLHFHALAGADIAAVGARWAVGAGAAIACYALTAGCVPFAVLTDVRWERAAAPLLQRIHAVAPDAPVVVAPTDEVRAITGYRETRGPLAAFHRPAEPSLDALLAGAHRVAVLEDVTNYTNIGAIFRSAAALGVDAVLLTPRCHDPLFRRASRVSMGTVFQVPWARIGTGSDWTRDGLPLLHDAGFTTVALALSDDSISIADARLKAADKLALVLGTEGDGLSNSTIAACDLTARIPMAHGVDSLNVAAASAVAFWETRWES